MTLVTSRPEFTPKMGNLRIISYETYYDLYEIMKKQITQKNYDVVIHSAAVSDYFVSNVLVSDHLSPVDASGKISSNHSKLYLELSPLEKIIDKIRSDWKFSGTLIKFKLEIGKTNEELISIATESVRASKANLIVANCLEWSKKSAIIVYPDGTYSKIERSILPKELWRIINEKDSLGNNR